MKKKPSYTHNNINETSVFIKLKNVFINAFLLLIPSFIFIVVKTNTVEQTIDWKLNNILIFFVIYVIGLSFFTFQPYKHFGKLKKYKKVTTITDTVTPLLSQHFRYIYIAVALFFVIFPFLFSMYQVKIMISVMTFLIFALGLNYTVGFAGFLNLGHVLPFAMGAYSYGLCYKYLQFTFLPGLLVGAIGGLIGATLVALLTIKLNGDYLAIVTLALAEIFKLLVRNVADFTGGDRGIPQIPLPNIAGISLKLNHRYIMLFYIVTALAILSIIITKRLIKSRYGRAWEANREDAIAAEASGINLRKLRLTVFSIGGLFAGVAGTIQASSATYINPSISGIMFSITVLSIVVLGGMGSIRGVVLGTIIVVMVPEYLRFFSEYRMLIYGALLVIMMRYRQRGILPQQRIIYIKDQGGKNA